MPQVIRDRGLSDDYDIGGLEAYKATKECRDKRIKYSTMTYLIAKNEAQSMVAIHFPSLDLIFLIVDPEKEGDDKFTPRPEASTNPPTTIDPPLTT